MKSLKNAVVCLALLLLPLAAHADGPNLFANPGFKSNLTGWLSSASPSFSESWVRTDLRDNPGSGSAKLIATDTGAGGYPAMLTQCLPLAPGSYILRGSAWVIGQPGESAFFLAQFYSGPHCAGDYLSEATTPLATAKAWTQVSVAANAPAGTASVDLTIALGRGARLTSPLTAYVDDLYFGTSKCAPGGTTLCLSQGRFKVRATWAAPSQPQALAGHPVSLADSDGTFWFVSPAEPDLDVRIVNFCAIDGAYEVFAGGLVDEGVVTLTVTDTKTGTAKTYQNAAGTTFTPLHDTAAFATCP